MPNEQNIRSPVTLISTARSGTSLVFRIFGAHPEFEVAGETASIIFGPWYAVERAGRIVRPMKEDGRTLSIEERATRVVHNTFLTLFYDERPRWMHKPIAVPEVMRFVARRQGPDATGEWYWRVMNHVFPDGPFITTLRSPFDVVLSQMDFFGRPEKGIWNGIARTASILTDPHSSVSHAVVYADLVADPESTLRKLFDDIEVPFHPRVTKPLDKIHAPAPGRENIDPKSTSRSEAWSRLNPEFVTPEIERAIARLWRKFGARFEVPEHFASHGIRFMDAPEEDRLQQIARDVLPRDAVALVVGHGYEGEVQLDGATGWHFPQSAEGAQSTGGPENDSEAIAHLEGLREKGAGYLLFPDSSFWWFDRYVGFRDYLNDNYQRVWDDRDCVIYQLSDAVTG